MLGAPNGSRGMSCRPQPGNQEGKDLKNISLPFRILILSLAFTISLSACHPAGIATAHKDVSEAITIGYANLAAFQSQIQPLIDEFEALNPGIRVQFVPIDNALGDTTLDFAYLASLADVLTPPVQPQAPNVRNFLDLQPILESDATYDNAAFWPGALEDCRVAGRLIGLPVATQPLLVMYNGAAFDAAGLDRPAPGWSWSDFAQAASHLSGTEGGLTRYGFVDNGVPIRLLGPLVASILHQSAEPDPAALAPALDWYVSLAQAGAIPVGLQDTTGFQDLIAQGQAAMWMGTLLTLNQRRQELGQDVGVAPFPQDGNTDTVPINTAVADCTLVSAGTAHPQAAWAWLKFIAGQSLPLANPAAISANIDVAQASATWQSLDPPDQAAVRYALEHAWYGIVRENLFLAINQALLQAMAGEVSLAQALAFERAGTDAATSACSTPDATPIVVQPPQPTATSAPAIAGSRSIRYFVDGYNSAGMEVLRPLADAFQQEHPDITINLIDPQTAGLQFVNIETVAEKSDCFAGSSGASAAYAPFLVDLGPLVDTDSAGQDLLAEIPPMLLAQDQVDGELYGLPVASRATMLFYNQDLFSAKGLRPPSPDWSIADFWTLAASAAGDGAYGFVPLDGRAFFDYLLSQYGIPLYDLTTTPPVLNFTDPAVVNTLSLLAEMAADKVIPAIHDPVDYRGGNAAQRYALVLGGQAAMWMDQAGSTSSFLAPADGPGFAVGSAPLAATGAPLPADTPGVSLYISRQAEDPAACWAWIKYLAGHPEAFPGIPLRPSILQSGAYEETLGPGQAVVYRAVLAQPHQSQNLDGIEVYPSYPLYVWWPDALASVFDGVPPTQAMTEMQAKAQAYLDCISLAADPNQQAAWLNCAQTADPDFELPHF